MECGTTFANYYSLTKNNINYLILAQINMQKPNPHYAEIDKSDVIDEL